MALASGSCISIASCIQRPNNSNGQSLRSARFSPPLRYSRRVACRSILFFPYNDCSVHQIAVFPDLLPNRAARIIECTWPVLIVGKETTDIFLTIRPTIGALPVIKVVLEVASIILSVFREPVFRVFVFGPVVDAEEVGPPAMTLVVLPFTYIEVATPIPERATSTSYSFLPVAFVIGTLAAGDHF